MRRSSSGVPPIFPEVFWILPGVGGSTDRRISRALFRSRELATAAETSHGQITFKSVSKPACFKMTHWQWNEPCRFSINPNSITIGQFCYHHENVVFQKVLNIRRSRLVDDSLPSGVGYWKLLFAEYVQREWKSYAIYQGG